MQDPKEFHDIEEFLIPGSDAQFEAIRGIEEGHASIKHSADLPGSDREEFAMAAMYNLNNADIVREYPNGDRPGWMFANTDWQSVGWINTENPEESTFFLPNKGVESYLENLSSRGREPTRELSVDQLESIRYGAPETRVEVPEDEPTIETQVSTPNPVIESVEEPEVTVEAEPDTPAPEPVAEANDPTVEVSGVDDGPSVEEGPAVDGPEVDGDDGPER